MQRRCNDILPKGLDFRLILSAFGSEKGAKKFEEGRDWHYRGQRTVRDARA
jgi:hypothetical protein